MKDIIISLRITEISIAKICFHKHFLQKLQIYRIQKLENPIISAMIFIDVYLIDFALLCLK